MTAMKPTLLPDRPSREILTRRAIGQLRVVPIERWQAPRDRRRASGCTAHPTRLGEEWRRLPPSNALVFLPMLLQFSGLYHGFGTVASISGPARSFDHSHLVVSQRSANLSLMSCETSAQTLRPAYLAEIAQCIQQSRVCRLLARRENLDGWMRPAHGALEQVGSDLGVTAFASTREGFCELGETPLPSHEGIIGAIGFEAEDVRDLSIGLAEQG